MFAIDPYLFRAGIKVRDILAFFIRITGQFRCGVHRLQSAQHNHRLSDEWR